MEIRAAGRRFGPSEQSLSAPVAPPAALQRDGSPLPPPDSEDEQDAAAEGTDTCTQSLHQAVWLGDVHQILELLEKQADVNAEDVHGVTPLMLAVELMPRAEEYQAVVDCLLHQGARPRVRSSSGWSPLDEAVSRRDGSLVRKLFDAAQQDLRQRWDVRLASIARSLELLPDFECQIRWEFDSPVIPLLNRIAPSDVIIVRKRGSCLRLDSTLASWKRFRFSKRRNLTTLFIGEKLDGDEKAARGLFMVNHDKLAVVDMTEGLDGEEAAAVVEDLVKADAMQWDMSIATLEVAESTTWLGSPAGVCDLNGWSCMRYEVRGELGMSMRKKGFRTEGVTFQDYFGHPLPVSACLPELRQKFEAVKADKVKAEKRGEVSRASESTGQGFSMEDDLESDAGSIQSELLDHWPEETGAPLPTAALPGPTVPAASPAPTRPSRLSTRDRLGSSSHKVSGSVWLATDFPIDMHQFLPVLEALAVEHNPMKRLKEIVESPSLTEAAKRARQSAQAQSGAGEAGHVFPVRASVPVNLAIRASLHFEAFTLGDQAPELFRLPSGYQEVPRSQLQKTANRAKKRMLIANLAL